MIMKSKRGTIGLMSLGCPKAVVDSETILNRLVSEGYQIVPVHKNPDLILVNTCGFINDAVAESLESIGEALQKSNKVIVTGCLGKRKAFIQQHYPHVLGVTGPGEYENILQLIQCHLNPTTTNVKHEDIALTPSHYAYLKISEGCNHQCTYCIIPELRGKLRSREMSDILREAERLVQRGVKEIILVAQDTLDYGHDLKSKPSFIELLNHLSQWGIWIRMHYLYPYPLLDEVVALMAHKKILPYLDLSFQHVNERLLKLMKRPAHRQNSLKRIRQWRALCPELFIRGCFIVGFPGETDEEFNELLIFLQEAQLDRAGCFKYSAVDGAKANQFSNPIAEEIKSEREDFFSLVQSDISRDRLRRNQGKIITVMIDHITGSQLIGRSPWDAPEVDGQIIIKKPTKNHYQPGDFIQVAITKTDDRDLFGEIK